MGTAPLIFRPKSCPKKLYLKDMNKLDNRKRRTSVLFWGIMNQLQGVGIALASQSKEGFVVAKNVKAA